MSTGEPHPVDVALPRGRLRIEVRQAAEPIEQLCGFGARAGNGRRPFLVVSRVLGKHVPVPPWRMAQIHEALASRIPEDIPGPVVMVGLAETATGLGAGVHEHWRQRTGRADADFIASTRTVQTGQTDLTFVEPHSHAVRHWLAAPSLGWKTRAYRSAVLIDDEITTGTTLDNLRDVLCAAVPTIRNVWRVAITDWSDGQSAEAALSLIRGRLTVEESIAQEHTLPTTLLWPDPQKAAAHSPPVPIPNSITEAAEHFRARSGTKVLVLGTTEFLHRPYQFAMALQNRGLNVWFQSTTRSPAHVWGEIRHALQFQEASEQGAVRFLYNVAPEAYDHIVVCRDTPIAPSADELPRALNAETMLLA